MNHERAQRLEETLERIENSPHGSLDPNRLLEVGALYQETLGDLGRARASGDERLQRSLNRLVARAYALIYRRRQSSLLDALAFLPKRFPLLVLARLHFIVTAFLIFLFSAVIGFLCVGTDSKLIDLVLPERMRTVIARDLAEGRVGRDMSQESKLAVSSFILTNNIAVSFKAFAYGIFLGLGTFYILAYNGLLLGGLAAVYHEAGQAIVFWSLILPHGAIELICCFIAGGAGLILGYALVDPGPHGRFEWLAHEGKQAALLVTGAVPMLFLAALIETWVTPAPLPIFAKYLVAAGVFLLTVVYLTWPALAQSWERSFKRR
ncbi:MAG TPA: stage II sporulation protein M [Candidatus Ozemobacteraceae bacterium]|nr:stage II sporulation protein M [Candidatus Ozemobacteraceae bacterium]